MQKQIGSILLIAGTCIGSGMIALPMVLATIGLIPSIVLMVAIWGLMYYSSLITLELHLQAGRGLSLGQLARHFSGPGAELAGALCLKVLSYALLSVYIYGGTSIILTLSGGAWNFGQIASLYTAIFALVLFLPLRWLDYINRLLFTGLIAVIMVLVAGLLSSVEWQNLPLMGPRYADMVSWRVLIPVIFTAFGFQTILHSITNYCNKDPSVLKKSALWGTLIPAIVYMIWTCGVLSVIYHKSPLFYASMVEGSVEVGDLVKELAQIPSMHSTQLFVWWISLLAIVTSLLGVGIGLLDSMKSLLAPAVKTPVMLHGLSVLVAVLPPFVLALLIPNAFITVLGFAGLILVVIAIGLPVYLFLKARIKSLHFSALRCRWRIIFTAIAGLTIMACEIGNIILR